MDTGLAVAPKQTAAVALAGVDDASSAILRDCFLQFGIRTVPVGEPEIAPSGHERFDGYVLSLDDSAGRLLASIRQTPENAHAVIYGICGSLQKAMSFSSYGINALFLHPLERQAALNVVRSTHLLVLHQLRRYVRVPLVSQAWLETPTASVPASTIEISAGGASVRTRGRLGVPQNVQVTFQLPGLGELPLSAVVCWVRREEETAGLRFEPGDPRRQQLRQWIEDYLPAD